MKIPALCTAACLFAAASSQAQTPVYTLPGYTGGQFTFLRIQQGREYADSAHLAGTDRVLQDATLAVYSDTARSATVTLSFYAAVPADFMYPPGTEIGQPGVTPGDLAAFKPADTPLWTSGPVAFNFLDDGPDNRRLNELVFADIGLLAPDDLFWSVKFENISGYTDEGPFGPKLENAADLGPSGAETDPSRFYARGPGVDSWLPNWLLVGAPPTSTLSLKLTAGPIPEPGVAILSAIGVFGWIARRRRA